jgi:hypothetical protein
MFERRPFYSRAPRYDVERARRLCQAIHLQGGAAMVSLALIALDRLLRPQGSAMGREPAPCRDAAAGRGAALASR